MEAKTIVISKSVTPRRAKSYIKPGKGHREFKDFSCQWKQVVVITETGRKKKNGKPVYSSITKHVPA